MTLIDQAGRGNATTHYLPAPPDLAWLAAEGWVQRYTPDMRRPERGWRVAPDAQPHLIVHRHLGGGTSGPRVVGARSTWVDVPVARRSWSVGVTFRPGALPALTGAPGADLTDLAFPAEDVWGAPGAILAESVAAGGSAGEVASLLWDFVRNAARRARTPLDWRIRGFVSLAPVHAVAAASAASAVPTGTRVEAIARALGVSTRTLRETWRREAGLAPSEALVIGRLHRALGSALASPSPRWSRVAHDAGFHDQSHLIRDFRRLLGETPEQFLSRGERGRR